MRPQKAPCVPCHLGPPIHVDAVAAMRAERSAKLAERAAAAAVEVRRVREALAAGIGPHSAAAPALLRLLRHRQYAHGIPTEQLLARYEVQGGECQYLQVPMGVVPGVGDPLVLSVEHLNDDDKEFGGWVLVARIANISPHVAGVQGPGGHMSRELATMFLGPPG